jgi:hypothetical protein
VRRLEEQDDPKYKEIARLVAAGVKLTESILACDYKEKFGGVYEDVTALDMNSLNQNFRL